MKKIAGSFAVLLFSISMASPGIAAAQLKRNVGVRPGLNVPKKMTWVMPKSQLASVLKAV